MSKAPATPEDVTENAPGWGSLITAARRLSVIHGALTVPHHDVNGSGLLFDIDANYADEDDRERVRGILAAIHAASTETCANRGGPGDPVTLESDQRSTRCADCREPGDVVRPRPPWHRERDPQDGRAHGAPLVEDLVGLEESIYEQSKDVVRAPEARWRRTKRTRTRRRTGPTPTQLIRRTAASYAG